MCSPLPLSAAQEMFAPCAITAQAISSQFSDHAAAVTGFSVDFKDEVLVSARCVAVVH